MERLRNLSPASLISVVVAAVVLSLGEGAFAQGAGDRETSPSATGSPESGRGSHRGVPAPDVDFAVTRHHLDIAQDQGTLTVRLDVDVQTYRVWTLVPLVPVGMALREVTLNGRSVPLLTRDDIVCAVASEPGEYHFVLELAPGPGSVTRVQLIPRPATTASITATGATRLPEIVPSVPIGPVVQGHAEVVIPPTDVVEITWAETSTAPAGDVHVRAVLVRQLEVTRIGVTGRAQVTASISGTPLGELTLEMPASITNLVVDGLHVRGMTRSVEGDRALYTLGLDHELVGELALDLRFTVAGPDVTRVGVPSLVVSGAETLQSTVLVTVESGIDVSPHGTQALDLVENLTAVQTIAPTDLDVVLAFRESREPSPDALFDIVRHRRQPVLDSAIRQARIETVVTDDDKAVTHATFKVVNKTKSYLELDVSEAAQVWAASVDGRATRPVRAASGRILIPIPRAQADGEVSVAFTVDLTFFEPVESPTAVYGSMALSLPTLHIVAADLEWVVHLPSRYSYFDHDGSLSWMPERFDNVGDEVEEIGSTLAREGLDTATGQGQQAPTPGSTAARVPTLVLDRTELAVPRRGRRLVFDKALAHPGEMLEVNFRFYDDGYVRVAEWLGLLSLFVAMLSVYAHLFFVVRKARLARVPRWTAAGLTGAFVFVVGQVLLPIALPPAWLLMLMFVFAGAGYGTVVFWTAIIGLLYKVGRAAGRLAKERGIAQALREATRLSDLEEGEADSSEAGYDDDDQVEQ